MEKFMGLGLKKLIAITVFVWIATVAAKTVLAKHPIAGLSDFIHAV